MNHLICRRHCWILCCLLMLPVSVLANIEAYQFDSIAEEDKFKKMIKELRCPKCQNQNLSDSNAPLAKDLRQKVYNMVKQGKAEQEITQYMIDRYGNFITYRPPMTIGTMILWFGPFFLLISALIMMTMRIKNKTADLNQPLTEEEKHRLQSIMKQHDKEAQ